MWSSKRFRPRSSRKSTNSYKKTHVPASPSPVRTNKDVIIYQKEHGEKLFLIALQLRHQVGALASLTTALEKGGYNILSGFQSTPDSDGYARCSFFIEATRGEKPTANELEQVIASSPAAKDVRVKEARNGIIVDTLSFPLGWNSGDRALMLRTEFFATMIEGLRNHFKSGADVVLHEMGFHHGWPTWTNLLKTYPTRDLGDLKEVIGFYDANGWGRTEAVAFNLAGKRAVVRFRDSFECSASRRAKQAGGNFVRGHLEGLFTVLFGEGTKVRETKCLCSGDPYCEFEASRLPPVRAA